MSTLIQTPQPSAKLPVNDINWQQNIEDKETNTLANPSGSIGVFASTLHTVYLLDCVFRHVTDLDLDAKTRSCNEEQLDRTLFAQIRYAESFPGAGSVIKCNHTALSFR